MKRNQPVNKWNPQILVAIFGLCILFFFMHTGAQEAEQLAMAMDPGQQWMPEELRNMEATFLELLAQVTTLDTYKPEAFADYESLEPANKLMESLDFNKRKFDRLIALYNQVEDHIFPTIKKLAGEQPNLMGKLYNKLKEYGGDNPKSILKVQTDINEVALRIERLEKKLERLKITARDKELGKKAQKDEGTVGKGFMAIAGSIQELEDERTIHGVKKKEEEERLKTLKEKEKKEADKIAEKVGEVKELKKKSSGANRVERLFQRIATKVREIRLNGLEIPRLNTLKTFIYLTETNIGTLDKQIQDINREIETLDKRRKKELVDNFIRGGIIIAIAIFMVLLLVGISQRVSKRLIKRVEASEKLDAHRKQRYNTLSAVTLSFIKILLWTLAVLWILGELDVDYGPFLVAAGGISLAIGFGAQSLVKDVVTGFFILMEEQFALGDVVELGGKTGTVEKISLRTIKFRGLDGTLHIISNGNISNVSNQTYQWSRAVVKIGVSYDADTGEVLKVLNQVCEDVAKNPEFKGKLLDKPSCQGILSFGDSCVNYRILAKTSPGDQWPVGREFNIRIKEAFDRHSIDIPYNYINIVDRTPKIEDVE